MNTFIKVKATNGKLVRLNVNHIISYEEYQKANGERFSRVFIHEDSYELSMTVEKIDQLLDTDNSKIEELAEENQRLADLYNKDVYALESKVEEMQKTLETFADINNWNPHDYGSFVPEWKHESKPWEIARQALKGVETE